jgi:hypothetical protein
LHFIRAAGNGNTPIAQIYSIAGVEHHFRLPSRYQIGKGCCTSRQNSGTLPLDRHHEDPLKKVAGAPSSASRDGEIQILRTEYDDFGNVTLVEGSNGHCSTTDFDFDYASLAQRNAASSEMLAMRFQIWRR